MKLERLISIIYRLLNNEVVSASELAEKYKVSQRTIYRDIDAICAAGIPVVSYQGANGGYGIIEEYKMDKSLLGSYDVASLITVLNSLSTVFKDDRATETIHRLQTVETGNNAPTMTLDIGSGRANNEFLRMLRSAIMARHVVRFEYINGKNERTVRIIEPVSLSYKFDMWYLYGYCRTRKDYREFKLSRLAEVDTTEEVFQHNHAAKNVASASTDPRSQEAMKEVVLLVSTGSLARALDVFQGVEKRFNEDGSLTLTMQMFKLYESEWFISMILGFGAGVEVIEPLEFRQFMRARIERMLEWYG